MRIAWAFLSVFLLVSQARSEDIGRLVSDAEKNLSQTALLEARFIQKTTVPFIDIPLRSDGKFCFDIRNRKKPMIFWEYQSPDVSGFRHEEGKTDFWIAGKDRVLSQSEIGYLNGMIDQILQWVTFDPKILGKTYAISAAGRPRSLKFVPKKESRLFSAIEMVLSRNMKRIDELSFHGKEGEVTTIKFDAQTINQPLSLECQH